MSAVVGPLRAVLAAVDAGEVTVVGLVRATGLPRDVVAAAVEHLTLTQRLSTLPLTCPPAGCGGCPVVCADAGASSGAKRLGFLRPTKPRRATRRDT
jgi:hypothetical protein